MQGIGTEHEKSNNIQQITFNSSMLCRSVGQCYLTVSMCTFFTRYMATEMMSVNVYICLILIPNVFPFYATE
jgi:hypothetical protein